MDETHLRRAVELALENARSGRGGPFGAVITLDGTAIAEGVNLVTATPDPTAHAEVVAIRAACLRLGRHDLRGGRIYASCEPCPMCLGAIYWARLDGLVYAATRHAAAAAGFDDSLLYAELPLPDEARRLECRHVALPDAGAPFDYWLRNPAKIPY
jgi:guanine deaminase